MNRGHSGEELTRIKLITEAYPEDKFRAKVLVERTSGASTIDVFMSMPAQEGLKYTRAGWLQPVDGFLKDTSLTSPDYNWNDFLDKIRDAMTIEGKLVGPPIQVENTAYPPVWVFQPTLDNYWEVFIKNPFFLFTWNSLVVAAGSTGLALLLGLPGSYAIARFKRTGIALAILTARMAPGIAYLIPWFILFTKLKMIDTYTALILTHLIVVLPLVLWVMIGFFEDVPAELIEAARIDGCSNFGAFLRVALPLVKPGIVATAILSFFFSWNNFLFSPIIAGFKTRTLPIAVYNFLSYEEINWGGLTAAATIITLPVLILSLFIQKHIVRGLTLGALKG